MYKTASLDTYVKVSNKKYLPISRNYTSRFGFGFQNDDNTRRKIVRWWWWYIFFNKLRRALRAKLTYVSLSIPVGEKLSGKIIAGRRIRGKKQVGIILRGINFFGELIILQHDSSTVNVTPTLHLRRRYACSSRNIVCMHRILSYGSITRPCDRFGSAADLQSVRLHVYGL